MKKVLAILGSIFLISSLPAYAADTAATPSIAVVNVQQLFQTSPKIAELNKQLQAKFKPRQDKLVAAQKSLQAELDNYKKESSTMSQKDRDALQKKIGDDQSTLQTDANAFQQDLNKEQSKIMKGVLAQLNEIISGLAKTSNYQFVLDSQAVIFAADGADITKQVQEAFDKKK
ncbi:MAG: OmpH family outer membrane protein [Gammaproteobacteria bacterium]|nr:OmpH family outer membrane protein [Gammaproteobacteria bacterium]